MIFITIISIFSTSISLILMLYGPGFSSQCTSPISTNYYLLPTRTSCKGSGSGSSTSTCGNQTISYPFRLKGNQSASGFPTYELSCVGNRTFFGAPYDKYLVTGISYQNNLIRVVHTDIASGKCNLPFQALTPSFFPDEYNSLFYPLAYHNYWVTFINCSKKIESNSTSSPYYNIVPCLSYNNRFIYFVADNSIISLHTSCSYLTMVPYSENVNMCTVSGDDIFQTLKDGFIIYWNEYEQKLPRFKIIYNCISGALRETRQDMKIDKSKKQIAYPYYIVYNFLGCVYSPETPYTALLIYSIALLVSLNILLFNIAVITIIRLIIAPLCIHVFLFYELLKMLAPVDYVEAFLRNQQHSTPTRYAYSDIVAMTRHFKDRLGQGGFGTVYKGELPGGHLLAVKLLAKSNDSGEDFINEVSTIGMIHHTNIVRLVGFCSEGLHRALIYEYMYNGSLDKYIFSSTQKFTTEKLNEIALGVARGIDYLHRGCDMRILHFDIKPSNVLLDGNFNPKVSDSGLAKLYPKDNSLVSTFAARGTIGYMAPELISRSFGHVSYKSDVYSFGMLLLEMAGGRRNFNSKVEKSSQAYYPSWIYDQLKPQKSITEGLNHDIEIEIEEIEKKLCKVGLWCIQMSPSSRPTMMRVLEMLEGDVDDVEMPPKPFFFSSSSQQTTRGQNSYELSFNEISTIYESE